MRREETRLAQLLLLIGFAAALSGACSGPVAVAPGGAGASGVGNVAVSSAPSSAPAVGDQIVGGIAAKADARVDATVGGVVSKRQQSQRVTGDGNTTGLPLSGREFTGIIIAAIAGPLVMVLVVLWGIRRYGYEEGKRRWIKSNRYCSPTSSSDS